MAMWLFIHAGKRLIYVSKTSLEINETITLEVDSNTVF